MHLYINRIAPNFNNLISNICAIRICINLAFDRITTAQFSLCKQVFQASSRTLCAVFFSRLVKMWNAYMRNAPAAKRENPQLVGSRLVKFPKLSLLSPQQQKKTFSIRFYISSIFKVIGIRPHICFFILLFDFW